MLLVSVAFAVPLDAECLGMKFAQYRCFFAGWLFAVPLLCGCGQGVEESGRPVSGQVTFQGKPLDRGSIAFYPAEGQGTLSGGQITNGQYTVSAEKGLEPGWYDVRISSTEGGPPPSDELPGEATVIPKERIPAEYNSKTTLKVEVKETGENKFDFKIP
jgi:hypothetical protein